MEEHTNETVTRVGGLDVQLSDSQIRFSAAGNTDLTVRLPMEFKQDLIDLLQGWQASRADTRTGFRVPVTEQLQQQLNSPIKAHLTLAGGRYEVAIADISYTGIALDCGEGTWRHLEQGASVRIDIQLDNEKTSLLATLRRRSNRVFAFSFENDIPAMKFEAPDSLIRVTRKLELTYIRMTRR